MTKRSPIGNPTKATTSHHGDTLPASLLTIEGNHRRSQGLRCDLRRGTWFGPRSLLSQALLLGAGLAVSPLAHAKDETPIPRPPAGAQTASGASQPSHSSTKASLDALLREEEEMRRKEEELLRRAAEKAANKASASPQEQLPLPPTKAVAVAAEPTHGNAPTPKPQKKFGSNTTPRRAKPRPTPTFTPEPTLVRLKGEGPTPSPTPQPQGTPVPTVSGGSPAPTSAKRAPAKPSPHPARSPAPARATEQRSELPPATPSVSTPASVPAASKAADPREAQLGLLRSQLAAATERNRQLEAELEQLRSQLSVSETEVERLNDFLSEQGRDYLNQASGSSSSGRLPSRSRESRERLLDRSSGSLAAAPSRGGAVSQNPLEPARSLEADQNVSIASVVSTTAVGRNAPSSSATVLGRLPEGAQVTVERESQGWYRVLTPQGTRVWVSGKDIAFGADGSVPPLRREQSSSILPPAQPQPSEVLAGSPGAKPEDLALEMLKQSMGQKQ